MQESLVVRLHPGGVARIKKRLAVRMLLALAFLVVFMALTQKFNASWIVVLVLFVVPSAISIIAYIRAVRRVKQRWESYTLMLDEQAVRKEQTDFSPVVIQRDKVTAVEETKDGALVVKTADKVLFIHIPPEVERRSDVVNSLAATIPITARPQQTFAARYQLLLVVWLGIIIAFFASTALVPVTLLGICILAILFYIHRQNRRYQAVLPKQTSTGLMIFFVPLIVALRILFILVGGK